MAEQILIVDDDEAVLTLIGKVIKSYGYQVEVAANGEEALEKVEHGNFDLMLLDINMPGVDGFEVIERTRRNGRKIPIIVISARRDEYDTLYGLNIGADDYITKPFNPIVLGAKVKALLRRLNQNNSEEPVITAGPFTYNTSSLRFFKNGEEIVLTGKENALMKLFMDNVNRIFSKEMLYDLVWGDVLIDENTIMVYINRLRSKIEDDPSKPQYIRNVRGIGYHFVV